MGSDQKRAIFAVVLSGLILFGWQYFFAPEVSTITDSTSSSEQVGKVESSGTSTQTSLNEAPKVEEREIETFTLAMKKPHLLLITLFPLKMPNSLTPTENYIIL